MATDGLPVIARTGEGAHFVDSDGRRHLGWNMGWGALLLGYRHPEVEAAIRDRWPSATAIPWETLERQPAHIEQAISQLCTNWSEDAHAGFETLAGWLEEISYGYHEVKLYLATVVFDLARHTETFRKRALAGGDVGEFVGVGVEGADEAGDEAIGGEVFGEQLVDVGGDA